MKRATRLGIWLGIAGVTGLTPVQASFHDMQIEQVIGGVNGDTSAQAIQLRMQSGGQNLVQQARLYAHDATGGGRTLLLDFPSQVASGAAERRVLITTAAFNSQTTPTTTPDFTMIPIPASYLAAGSLTFEDNFATVYWRLSWGGVSYTGLNTGSTFNDPDGNYGPPFSGPLPSSGTQALQFRFLSSSDSTNNANDYLVTAGAAVFVNNANGSFTVTGPIPTGACCNDSNGVCTPGITEAACTGGGGRYAGDGSANCDALDPPCTGPTGACCDDDTGVCTEDQTQPTCTSAGNRYGGDDSTCATISPTCEPIGACCVPQFGTCLEDVSETDCNGEGGRFEGAGSTCATLAPPCEPVLAISLPVVASGLVSPTNITHAGDGSGRLFITDQVGLIRIVDNTGTLLNDAFLDIRDRMITPDPGFDERGLLGLAFHPDYETNGRFFVRYSAPRTGVAGEPCFGTSRGCSFERLSEFLVSGDPNVGDPDSEIILIEIVDPQFNHNAGEAAFGPDGMLYISMGDGGGRDDGLSSNPPLHGPIGSGQNLETMLGKMLRIDVDSAPDLGLNYHIPADNPFVGFMGGPDPVDEIWAYGFRNPFSFAFDDGPGGDGALYLGDVGQELFEELNIVTVAGNYGWVIREGLHCFDPINPTLPPASCPTTGPVLGDTLIDPVLEYLQPLGCSSDLDCEPFGVGCGNNGLCLNEGGISIIVGGVYRGTRFPALSGKLVFGDFAQSFGSPTGRLYYTDLSGPEAFERKQFFLWPNNAPLGRFVKGMGRDEDGELYVCASQALAPTGTTGEVLRVAQPLPALQGVSPRYLEIIVPNNPSPFALLVTPACGGSTSKYVGPPSGSENIALLVDDPADAEFRNSQEWGGTLRVTGADVVPDADYEVQMDGGTPGSPDLSEVTSATTRRWGDVAGPFIGGMWTNPDGQVDITIDVTAILDKFRSAARAPALHKVDLVGQTPFGIGCQPDRSIAILDVTMGLDAFRSIPYVRATPCTEPCP